MNPQSPMKIPGPSNGFVATSLDKLVKEEEYEEPPLPKKSKKNNHAPAIKQGMRFSVCTLKGLRSCDLKRISYMQFTLHVSVVPL